jgi:hypothetical protein
MKTLIQIQDAYIARVLRIPGYKDEYIHFDCKGQALLKRFGTIARKEMVALGYTWRESRDLLNDAWEVAQLQRNAQ